MKLRQDIQDMVQDDLLMGHLIDELLLLSRDLTLLGYPPSSPSPLSLFLEHTSFQKWRALERQCKFPICLMAGVQVPNRNLVS